MELEEKELLDYFSENNLKDLLKFYNKNTINKEVVEIELGCLLSDKEYKQLLRILYG